MALKSKNRVKTDFSMSSMTDIMFLLLVFFILASKDNSPQGMKLDLPTSKVSSIQLQKIDVTVTADLETFINGKVIADNDVESKLTSVLEGLAKDEKKVILNYHKEVPVKYLVNVLSISSKLGATCTIRVKRE